MTTHGFLLSYDPMLSGNYWYVTEWVCSLPTHVAGLDHLSLFTVFRLMYRLRGTSRHKQSYLHFHSFHYSEHSNEFLPDQTAEASVRDLNRLEEAFAIPWITSLSLPHISESTEEAPPLHWLMVALVKRLDPHKWHFLLFLFCLK